MRRLLFFRRLDMRKKTKNVAGIGVNDSILPATSGQVYKTWRRMLDRCYGAASLRSKPTYAGCSVVDEWHVFSVFEQWMTEQNWEGMELDKDILIPGNKVYGPETCVFVPLALNRFLNSRSKARGEWPIGVSLCKRYSVLQAQCNNPFARKVEGLGYFTDPAEAHEAWRAKKHEHACRYADMQTDPRIAAALRSRYSSAEDFANGAR